jgi:hypothetical protein
VEAAEWKYAVEDKPWTNEPRYLAWVHEWLLCVLLRGVHNAWCGYVGLPPWHPLHGAARVDIDADIYGGITWAAGYLRFGPTAEDTALGIWWVGWDCAHAYDITPDTWELCRTQGPVPISDSPDGARLTYKTCAFAVGETERLAAQLSRMGNWSI